MPGETLGSNRAAGGGARLPRVTDSRGGAFINERASGDGAELKEAGISEAATSGGEARGGVRLPGAGIQDPGARLPGGAWRGRVLACDAHSVSHCPRL